MIRHGYVVFAALLFSSTLALAALPKHAPIPDYDLEMSSREIQNVLSQRISLYSFKPADDTQLQVVLDTGKRNLDWLDYINQFRDDAHKISLTSAATERGIPIDHPSSYNPDLIRKGYDTLMNQVPEAMKSVLTGSGPFPQNPPVPDDVYINWGHLVDNAYQMASRWLMMEPYLDQMAQRQDEDVRGYYFLSKIPDIVSQLKNWISLAPETQKLYAGYLLQICMNNDAPDCQNELEGDLQAGKAADYYNEYIGGATQLWNSFFTIAQARTDLTWKTQPEELDVPFVDPNNDKIKNFLADNIQDEWRWDQWHLILKFGSGGNDTPHMVFVPGATPHVNGIAGNEITMDANAPLTEYDVRWTIRHEFGHVLGFPDCYVEFYDQANQVMIDYQLDITNLMCSRVGHIQQRHYDELKRVYGPGTQVPLP